MITRDLYDMIKIITDLPFSYLLIARNFIFISIVIFDYFIIKKEILMIETNFDS